MKTEALISCAVTVHLICVFVFAYAKSRVTYNEAHLLVLYVRATEMQDDCAEPCNKTQVASYDVNAPMKYKVDHSDSNVCWFFLFELMPAKMTIFTRVKNLYFS